MARSLVAIAFGVLIVALLGAMANAVVLHGAATGPMPAPLEVMMVLMHALAALAGGYLGAAVARRRPATHGLAVGVAYLLAVQLVPSFPIQLIPLPVTRPLGLTAVGMVMALAGAVLGGLARGQTGEAIQNGRRSS